MATPSSTPHESQDTLQLARERFDPPDHVEMVRVARARHGQKYYCNALAGEADYDITINSDLTVSCCCQDYDGTGHLGSLRKNSFEEVFFGPVAQKFPRRPGEGKNSDPHLRPLRFLPQAGEKCRAAQTASALSRDVTGKHGALQRGTASAARAKARRTFAWTDNCRCR